MVKFISIPKAEIIKNTLEIEIDENIKEIMKKEIMKESPYYELSKYLENHCSIKLIRTNPQIIKIKVVIVRTNIWPK